MHPGAGHFLWTPAELGHPGGVGVVLESGIGTRFARIEEHSFMYNFYCVDFIHISVHNHNFGGYNNFQRNVD
jgi:hypothetical protein